MRKFKKFFENEAAGGIVLIICAALALIIANIPAANAIYSKFLHFHIDLIIGGYEVFNLSFEHFINDALMAIFFVTVAIEIKQEMLHGHLASFKQASFPFFGALGGMVVPILIYFALTFSKPELIHGAAIPMATDIAFAIGVLSLLGKLVPPAMKVFLLALAVIDDLGAIVVIAIFYTTELNFLFLFIAFVAIVVMFIMNRRNVRPLTPYIIMGIITWYCLLHSGVHATIAGVLTGFLIPNRDIRGRNLSMEVLHYFEPYVKWFIIPFFAFANSGVTLGAIGDALLPNLDLILGIFFGLFVGKPVGVFLFTYVCSKLGITQKPTSMTWSMTFLVGIICGIGFTMSIFIVNLSFPGVLPEERVHIDIARLSILCSSAIAAIVGLVLLQINLKRHQKKIK
ncbi:Na+/H+ antiporter NhaA [Psittacicella hinzii]|uniref:Na(+)/H(+) antiporter NhaA n=1 Tax=Psittacicella hinzii TaxID=2028575 RepID=A0A3A1YF20_9GAMM|nr:Na+/H+ antiporter NhaA [Psittacicella hinzii]RIY36036.1 Na+/H+ antiporter NhaA [Psittacicella hinzii]